MVRIRSSPGTASGPLPVPPASPSRANATKAAQIADRAPSAWNGLGGADLAQVFIQQLRARIEPMTADQLRELVEQGEEVTEHGSVELRRKISAEPDDEIPVSMARVRPGQSQLSFDHVRSKLIELLDAIAASPRDVVTRFLAGDRLRGFLDDRGDVTLVDGHHKFTALLALRGLTGMSMFGGTHVPVLFVEPRDPSELFLDRVAGRRLRVPPKRFAALEDNPYRKLAAELCVKVRGEPGAWRLDGPERPLWVKGGRAPEFIEFDLARTIKKALEEVGVAWKPGEALAPEAREAVRKALLARADHETFRLDDAGGTVVVPQDWSKAQVLARLRVGRKKGKLQLGTSPQRD